MNKLTNNPFLNFNNKSVKMKVRTCMEVCYG